MRTLPLLWLLSCTLWDEPYCGAGFYEDVDGDGFGDPSAQTCEPDGSVRDKTDCDDADATVHPGAEEVCGDGVVNDCGSTAAETRCAAGDFDLGAEAIALVGEAPNDYAGVSVAAAGDVNGDGLDDILIGATSTDTAAERSGSVYLVLGGISSSMSLSDAHARLDGLGALHYVGGELDGAGDVDGDGLADIIVGSSASDVGGDPTGAAYLVLGGVSGEVSLADAHAILLGEDEGDRAGDAVSGIGDVTGDGLPDLLVGARDHQGSGMAYVVQGTASGSVSLAGAHARLAGTTEDARAGSAIDNAGDTDGDGIDDIIVGAIGAGAVYLVLGGVSGEVSLADAHASYHSLSAGDLTGTELSGAGDVNGDGLSDIIIGAPYHGDHSGEAYIFLGGGSGIAWIGDAHALLISEAPGDAAGWSVSRAGDLNHDGLDDVLVGAIWAQPAGRAYLVLGGTSGSVSLSDSHARFHGSLKGDMAGTSVSTAGDTNGDGFTDILVGTLGADEDHQEAGTGYLFLGRGY